MTPLHYAVIKNCIEGANILIIHSADINERDVNDKTPLHYAVECEDTTTIAEMLVSNNDIEIDARDKNDKTPLHYAAKKLYFGQRIVSLLLSHGANIDAIDAKGKTPLDHALHYFYLKPTAKYLIACGASKSEELQNDSSYSEEEEEEYSSL
ncbi:ankyrin repeat protein, putative [Trichomonas vaginalis G3]|uniref:Ankyrin repeat protein, putative n=1 Tax=Trichomonas vaginalis (strain ATCC PRA-98 / G3) TaxID=412133 RepID=A2DPX7_TRIV3|nr:spectrin binding [Trichomonas vaginalis G3]EAY17573.1 ankyrin repeat protein, putative [Trichomonas vaginalis G3]KAI5520617.1 spectrin binding [Trichomonas vaginalis G3]|eukprot:XP_001329708.1 ankyrin repeat protein [Trichomonas vaginalis G3]